MPKPPSNTLVSGIFQPDLIIRTAIIAALDEMVANPDLLDYAFQSLNQDGLTVSQYGQKDIDQAKKWFTSTSIPVLLETKLDHALWPCIVISLLDSVESEFTLGDVHYQPQENAFEDWPIIVNKFTPVAYSASAGMIKIPLSALGSVILDTGMVLIDRSGNNYPVLEVLDDDTIGIAPNTVADFSQCMIKDADPGLIVPMESINNRESYQLQLLVQGESIHLIYLWSILTFALNRRKQDLLEARGFERSSLSSGKIERFMPTETEVVYGRTVNLVGYVRQVWVKPTKQVIQGIGSTITVGKEGTNAPGYDDVGVLVGDSSDLPWSVEN